MSISCFRKNQVSAETALQTAKEWEGALRKKCSKPSQDTHYQMLKTAKSISTQVIDSLESEKHGHIWIAYKDKLPCAILIGDDSKKGLVIRYLVANLLNEDSKGSGSFLVQEMIALAKRTNQLVLTRPENSEKYWKQKMGFTDYSGDVAQLAYIPK